MDTATRVQILDETDGISHSTNTLGKGMNPITLPPGQTGFFSLGEATQRRKTLKPVKLRLKIDLVSYPARAKVLVYMILFQVFLSNIDN